MMITSFIIIIIIIKKQYTQTDRYYYLSITITYWLVVSTIYLLHYSTEGTT